LFFGWTETSDFMHSFLTLQKILHTRKRIRRILHNPPETPTPEIEAHEDDSVNSSQRKKSSSVTKRNTYYGTLGRRSKSTPKRPQSISRPLSTGESDFSDALQTREQTAFGTLRHRREPSMGLDENIFTSETPTTRESDSDNSSRRNSDSFDTRRWSRLSSNSQHSDKVCIEHWWKKYKFMGILLQPAQNWSFSQISHKTFSLLLCVFLDSATVFKWSFIW